MKLKNFKYTFYLSSDKIRDEFYYPKNNSKNKNQLLYIIQGKDTLLKVAIQFENKHN